MWSECAHKNLVNTREEMCIISQDRALRVTQTNADQSSIMAQNIDISNLGIQVERVKKHWSSGMCNEMPSVRLRAIMFE